MDLEQTLQRLEGGSRCINLIESSPNAIYDYATAAGEFAQVNGVLAALVFAAFVFILERSHNREHAFPVALILLPVTFGVAIVSAYKYSIVHSYMICETVAMLATIAGPSFAFVVLAIIATMATMFAEIEGEVGKSAYLVTVALLFATAALAISNVAITVSDASVAFGFDASASTVVWHTLMGLLAAAIVLLVFHILVNRRQATRIPLLRLVSSRAVVPIFAIMAAGFVVVSGALFAYVGTAVDWTSEVSSRAIGDLLSRTGWMAPVVTGLMAGFLGAVTWWEYSRLGTASLSSGEPEERK